jgi:hypothetical protein
MHPDQGGHVMNELETVIENRSPLAKNFKATDRQCRLMLVDHGFHHSTPTPTLAFLRLFPID